jgi:hypothetical protein
MDLQAELERVRAMDEAERACGLELAPLDDEARRVVVLRLLVAVTSAASMPALSETEVASCAGNPPMAPPLADKNVLTEEKVLTELRGGPFTLKQLRRNLSWVRPTEVSRMLMSLQRQGRVSHDGDDRWRTTT